MTLSINTNKAALDNVQQFNKLSSKKTDNQNALATGKAVNSFKDNAAVAAIASRLSGEVRAFESAQIATGVAEALAGVSIAAGEATSDLLIEAKGKAVLAQSGGLSASEQQAIQDDISGLLDQVDSIVSNASFNEVNLVDSVEGQGGQTFSTLATPQGDKIDVDAPAFDRTALGIDAIDVTSDAAGAFAALDGALEGVTSGVATLGAFANQLEANKVQLSNQLDQITIGVGAIVDADLGREAAIRTSNDIRSQLQTQTASIANAAPSVIGQLF